MAKNTHKQSKKRSQKQENKKASFELKKSEFKKFIKGQCANAYAYSRNILSGINFEFNCSEGTITLASTDGNRLLETKFNCYSYDDSSDSLSVVFDGFLLRKISFLKNMMISSEKYIDVLSFEMTEEYLKIEDVANKIVYSIPAIKDNLGFPDYKQLFPKITKDNKKEYTTVGLNIEFLKDLKNLAVNKRINLIKLTFKNNNPTACVLVESTNGEDIATRTIVMPIDLRA